MSLFEVARNVFAVIGALVILAWAWLIGMWAWSVRDDRKKRASTYLPPADDPAWDRLLADLLDQDKGEKS